MKWAAVLVSVWACTPTVKKLGPPIEGGDDEPEVNVVPAGTLATTTDFGVTPGALVATPAKYTATLSAYTNTPGEVLAETGHIPSELAAQIDAALAGTPQLVFLGVQTGVEGALEHLTLHGELAFGDDATVTNTIDSVEVAAFEQTFDVANGSDEIASGSTTTTHAGYSLAIGEHDLALDLGAYAFDGADAQLADQGGIRGVLGGGTNCSALALAISHPEIADPCEAALDDIVAQAEADAASYRVAMHLSGDAGMLDADEDGVADGLFAGTWHATLDAGDGAVAMDLSFQ